MELTLDFDVKTYALADATNVGNCPTGSQVRYSISAGSRPGRWARQNLADPSEPLGSLAVARIGGQNVYLSAGRSPGSTSDSGFQIGLPETGYWPAIVARGGSTQGTWGASTVTATSYSRAVLWPDATTNVQSATVGILGGRSAFGSGAHRQTIPTS